MRGQTFVVKPEDRLRIEQALPSKAIVTPAKPRRLLIFTLNVGYGGHPSMAYANQAFALMGRKTGAFETYVTNDPAIFRAEELNKFDAVFFNNTVGNCFTNAELRENLLEFITSGGGLLGVHGTTVAFTQWPGAIEDWSEFGYVIGARGANHKDSDEHVWLKLDDPANPILQVFGGQGFDYRDEFFRPQGTYSRDRVRVLLSIDTSKTDPNKGQPRGNCYRADNDYAVAWIRSYGLGRVFYCTIAHNPYVFWDPKMLQFYLAAAQFALGDLACPTTPSAKLTPAILAEEKLGWRLVVQASGARTLIDELQRATQAQVSLMSLSCPQPVGTEISGNFGPQLADTELTAIRLELEKAGVRLVSCRLSELPSDESGWRKLIEFARKMGVETFVSDESLPQNLEVMEKCAKESGINFAFHLTPFKASGQSQIAERFNGRNQRVGASVELTEWLRAGADPALAARTLQTRLLAVQLGPAPIDETDLEKLLVETRRLHLRPVFLMEGDSPSIKTLAQAFGEKCLKLQ